MKLFVYTYLDRSDNLSSGKIRASTLAQAKQFLKKKRLNIVSIHERQSTLKDFLFTDKKVRNDDLVAFTQLFSSCVVSGIPIKDALVLLSKQMDNVTLRNRITAIILDLESGTSLSDSFLKHIDIFPAFYPMLIKAGESSGDLGTVLDYMGSYLDRINTLKKELITLFTYPAIVSAIGVSLLYIILLFVAPVFREVFMSNNVPLPVPTQILFFFSETLSQHLYFIAGLFGLVFLSGYALYRTREGRRWLHYRMLLLPLFGKVIRETVLLRFLKAFEVLVQNNVPILEALKVLEESTTNVYLKDIILAMRRDVSRGLSLSGPLVASREVISPMVSYTISMGENSGTLADSLSRISLFVDRELGFSIKKLSARLDPLLTLFMGLLVLVIALAIYLPIFDMMSTFR